MRVILHPHHYFFNLFIYLFLLNYFTYLLYLVDPFISRGLAICVMFGLFVFEDEDFMKISCLMSQSCGSHGENVNNIRSFAC